MKSKIFFASPWFFRERSYLEETQRGIPRRIYRRHNAYKSLHAQCRNVSTAGASGISTPSTSATLDRTCLTCVQNSSTRFRKAAVSASVRSYACEYESAERSISAIHSPNSRISSGLPLLIRRGQEATDVTGNAFSALKIGGIVAAASANPFEDRILSGVPMKGEDSGVLPVSIGAPIASVVVVEFERS